MGISEQLGEAVRDDKKPRGLGMVRPGMIRSAKGKGLGPGKGKGPFRGTGSGPGTGQCATEDGITYDEMFTEAVRDNQNVDLEAAKRWKEKERKSHETGRKLSAANYEKMMKAGLKAAEWTKVKGIDVLRIGNEPYIAIPVTGKKNAAKFDILDMRKKGEKMYMCQLKKKEVGSWLGGRWKDEHGF